MPTTKSTITITDLQDAAGNLLGNAWLTVRLNAGANGGVVDGAVIATPSRFQTDADGDASIQLYPNSAITPAGSYYTISVDETSPLIYRTISVPSGGVTKDWSDATIQTTPVSPDLAIPAASSAADNSALFTTGTDYELRPIALSDVTSLTSSLTTLAGAISDGDEAVQANVDEIDAIVGPGPLPAVGLLSGLSRLTGQVPAIEGILDRYVMIAAAETAANITVSTYTAGAVGTQPTLSHGTLTGISGLQRPYVLVLLTAQTDPAENRIYWVSTSNGQWSVPSVTDIFYPPGNFYRAVLSNPGGSDHLTTWMWLFDDRSLFQRGGNYGDGAVNDDSGAWYLAYDPTGSGGGVTDGSITTAKLADSAVTSAKIANGTIVAADLASDLAALIPIRIAPSSNTSVTSSTTLVDITGLSFAVTAGRTYDFDGILFASGDSAGDGKIGVTFPAGTMRCGIGGLLTSASSLPGAGGTGEVIDASGESVRVGLVTGSTTPSVIGGTYVCTSSGTVQFQWAQNASSATASVLEANGSRISYTSRPT